MKDIKSAEIDYESLIEELETKEEFWSCGFNACGGNKQG